jgi:hypothetical protein
MRGPVPIVDQEPLRIQGIQGQEQSIPVNVKLGPKK